MAKKMNKVEKVEKAEIKVNGAIMAVELREKLEQYKNVSLRRIAENTGVSYAWLLKSSKKPVAGEAYNPDAMNYVAVAEVLAKRDIVLADLPWEQMNVENKRNSAAKLSKNPEDFGTGTFWFLRGSNVVYEVIYTTSTNVVLLAHGSTVPMNLSWATFFQKGPCKERKVPSANNRDSERECVDDEEQGA